MSRERGTWGSKTGFVLVAAGSAVGLGNIWAFPTQVGQGGGAAFVILYLVCVTVIGFPILVAELAMGRHAHSDPVGSFKVIKPGTRWWLVGLLAVLAPTGILSFYAVIAGWTVAYVWHTGSGAVAGSPDEVATFFAQFTSRGLLTVGLTLAVLLTTAGAVVGGVRAGIERFTKRLMPLLLVLLVVLAVRAVNLPGAEQGLAYYLAPDLGKLLDLGILGAALGQAFFSLSLGMGIMITYGSYLDRREGIAVAAVWVVGLDTLIALLAGFIIFPAGFSMEGFDPAASGPGLIFSVLPRVFAGLPQGQWFGAAFFLLLSLAALTSMISLLEVPVAHLIDQHGYRRPTAVALVTTAVFTLAIPSALANGAVGFFGALPGLGVDFLTLMVTLWNNVALPIGGLLVALFVGYVWKVEGALDELRANGAWFPGASLWVVLVRYVCPGAILLVVTMTLGAAIGW